MDQNARLFQPGFSPVSFVSFLLLLLMLLMSPRLVLFVGLLLLSFLWEFRGRHTCCRFASTLLHCSQFSATKTHQRQTETLGFPAQPWQSQTGPDPLCLDAIELIQAFLPNKYDQSCRSFLDGVGPCRRPFGNRRGCHGLSFDLSSVLSSTCHSRDLILEIHP